MIKRLSPGIFLILLFPLLLGGMDKSKKAYELIYKDVQLLRQQILELDKKTEKNKEDIEIIKSQLDELINMSKLFQSEQASVREDQKKLPAQYQILLEKLEAINMRLSRFSEDLIEIKKASYPPEEQKEEEKKSELEQVPPKKTVEKEQTEEEQPFPSPRLSPQEVYNMAYSDYLKGNFQLAIDGFKIYLEQFPESPLADNALYWIGECYFSQRKFEEAIDQFNELILNYHSGDKIPAGYLKKGISLMEIGKKEDALSVFKLLVSKYPLEEETKIAQQKIKELLSEK